MKENPDMSNQLEMFTTSVGLAGYKEIPALDRPAVAISNNAPETSQAAGVRAKGHSGEQRKKIQFWIKWASKLESKGMTADEISMLLEYPAQSVSARINGLHKDGWIVDTGLRRNTRYGRKAIVWAHNFDLKEG